MLFDNGGASARYPHPSYIADRYGVVTYYITATFLSLSIAALT